MSGTLPTQIKLLESIRDVPREAWDALVDAEAAPFLEWSWLEALESSGSVRPGTGWRPRHLTLWRGNHLVAAAPAYLKEDSHGEFVFDWSWATAAERVGLRYYPKLILAAPLTPATGRRVMVARQEDRGARTRELMRAAVEYARSEGLSSLHVLFPTPEEAKLLEEEGFGIRHGVQYHFQNEGYGSFEDVLARFTSKRRNQIRRERRATAEHRVELRTLRGEALADVDPAEVYRLYASTVDKFAWGRRYLTEDFFIRVLQGLPAPGGAGAGPEGGTRHCRGLQRLGRGGPLRTLLGVLRGGAFPALRRLRLPGHARDGGAGAEALRARGRGRAQARPGLPPGPHLQRALDFSRSARPGRPGIPGARAHGHRPGDARLAGRDRLQAAQRGAGWLSARRGRWPSRR